MSGIHAQLIVPATGQWGMRIKLSGRDPGYVHPMSKSMTAVLKPFLARPMPKLAAVVVLPTPPLPDVTHTTLDSPLKNRTTPTCVTRAADRAVRCTAAAFPAFTAPDSLTACLRAMLITSKPLPPRRRLPLCTKKVLQQHTASSGIDVSSMMSLEIWLVRRMS